MFASNPNHRIQTNIGKKTLKTNVQKLGSQIGQIIHFSTLEIMSFQTGLYKLHPAKNKHRMKFWKGQGMTNTWEDWNYLDDKS